MERWLRVLILSGVCALSTGCASLNLPSFQLPFLRDKVAVIQQQVQIIQISLVIMLVEMQQMPVVQLSLVFKLVIVQHMLLIQTS